MLFTKRSQITNGRVIAIDGKTLRRSYDHANGKAAIHMVSAWATENHVGLGQRVVDEKSNEITAIPKLLEIIEVSGALVTIDAMGCQVEIAAKISEEEFAKAVRGHRGIENSLHWQLDVSFKEDDCRLRIGYGDENFRTLRRTALNLLEQEKTAKCVLRQSE